MTRQQHHHRTLSGFNPLAVPNCTAYWNSDLGITTSGGVITAWADQSGNGRNLSPVASPTYAVSNYHGHSGVTLNGSTQYFSYGSIATSDTGYTMFVMAATTDNTHYQTLVGENGIATTPAHRELIIRGASGPTGAFDHYVHDTVKDVDLVTGNIVANNTVFIANGRFQSGASPYMTAQLNNGTETTYTVSGFSPTGDPLDGRYVGAEGTTGAGLDNFFVGWIYMVIIYNRRLSDAETVQIRDGMNEYYGHSVYL